MTSLIERIEAAMGPCRELDAEIACRVKPWREMCSLLVKMPPYTSSIDAALTLVPDGWHVGLLTECGEDNSPKCCLTYSAEPCRDAEGAGVDLIHSALAAALRARGVM